MAKRSVFILILLLIVAGCGSEVATNQPIASGNSGKDEYPMLHGDNLHFIGTIDGKLDIHMRLSIDGQKLTGSYYYDTIGKEILLQGWIDGPQIRITEYDENQKEKAEFRGALVEPGRIDGIWRRTESWRGPIYPVCLVAEDSGHGQKASADKKATWEGTWKKTVFSRAGDTTVQIAFLNDKSFWVHLLGYSGGHSGFIRGMALITPEGAVYKDGSGAEMRFSVENGKLIVAANAEGKQRGGSVVFEGVYTRGERMMLLLKDIGVFRTEMQEEAFRIMTGPYYDSFLTVFGSVDKKEDMDGFGAKVYGGYVRGLILSLQGIVMWTDNGRMWAAILSNKKDSRENSAIVYFTNDERHRKIIPRTIQKWIGEMQAKRDEKVEVIFYY